MRPRIILFLKGVGLTALVMMTSCKGKDREEENKIYACTDAKDSQLEIKGPFFTRVFYIDSTNLRLFEKDATTKGELVEVGKFDPKQLSSKQMVWFGIPGYPPDAFDGIPLYFTWNRGGNMLRMHGGGAGFFSACSVSNEKL